MQIQAIKVNNLIGSRRADLYLRKPITLFCGANGASKSSIQEAVRMAFTGKTLRVDLKKEYPLLVSEGAKSGSVVITTDTGTASFELPSGNHVLDGDLKLGLPDALEYVLNAQGFSSLTPEARRTFLFGLTDCKVTTKEVKRRLKEKACNEAKIDMAIPMLHSGFPAAADLAAKKATEFKGIWKGLTGETWGNKKGDGWTAEKPEFDQAEIDLVSARLAEINEQGNKINQEIGALQAQQRNSEAQVKELAEKKDQYAKLERIRKKLELDEQSLIVAENNVTTLSGKAGTGKKEGLIHDLARFVKSIDFGEDGHPDQTALVARYELEHGSIDGQGDPEAAEQLPSMIKARDMMKNAVANGRRDLAAAENAKIWLDQNSANTPKDVKESLEALQATVANMHAERDGLAAKLETLKLVEHKAINSDKITKDAGENHTHIMEWLSIAESLAPDGIPAEMLAQALRPINNTMKEASIATGWRAPSINADMSITAEGRPYSLLSKSEKWRVDAMIAEAIAQLSGVKVLMLDEVDILELDARVQLLYWMDDLAAAGILNTVLLFGTLKQKPAGLPENISAVWLENGVIPEIEAAEAAA